MDRLHGGIEAHGPSPEQLRALGRRTAIHDLIDFPIATVATHGQDGPAMHREQQRRAIEEGDREHVERVVVKVTVGDREGGSPVEMREDTERRRLGPGTHHHRANEANHQIKPDRGGKGPRHMRTNAQA